MNEAINEELIQKEMQKVKGAAIPTIAWFHLFAFIDHAMTKDEMFASQEDMKTIQTIVKNIHDQIFPTPKTDREELEETLKLKPKKIIGAEKTLIV